MDEIDILENLLMKLTSIAEKSTTAVSENEDVLVVDVFGTNVDDAYEGGLQDGCIFMARDLVKEFGNENNG